MINDMHLKDLYQLGKENMRRSLIENPALETSILLSKTNAIKDISEIHAYPEKELDNVEVEEFYRLLERRINNEPIVYITGEKEFYSRTFSVNRDVLIPRPETELLVEEALRTAVKIGNPAILDVGTGSGCIAVTLACEKPGSRVVASDISRGALATARANAERHSTREEISFVIGSLTDPFQREAFDLVVSNPPYIPEAEYALLPPDVRDYEPRSSLVGGGDGLYYIRRLISGAGRVLKNGGWCLLEIGAGQSPDVIKLFEEARFSEISSIRDINDIERVVRAQWKK
ncbi:MAG: peptide chain release factor N(5)-glutamine methyltransferase [Candidatus Dadabacteria bacterium]|nr:peptide chain release factor N(5)-glutamine methyltransferase [Candidatus Dadabacteria bacterium]